MPWVLASISLGLGHAALVVVGTLIALALVLAAGPLTAAAVLGGERLLLRLLSYPAQWADRRAERNAAWNRGRVARVHRAALIEHALIVALTPNGVFLEAPADLAVRCPDWEARRPQHLRRPCLIPPQWTTGLGPHPPPSFDLDTLSRDPVTAEATVGGVRLPPPSALTAHLGRHGIVSPLVHTPLRGPAVRWFAPVVHITDPVWTRAWRRSTTAALPFVHPTDPTRTVIGAALSVVERESQRPLFGDLDDVGAAWLTIAALTDAGAVWNAADREVFRRLMAQAPRLHPQFVPPPMVAAACDRWDLREAAPPPCNEPQDNALDPAADAPAVPRARRRM